MMSCTVVTVFIFNRAGRMFAVAWKTSLWESRASSGRNHMPTGLFDPAETGCSVTFAAVLRGLVLSGLVSKRNVRSGARLGT